MKKYFPIAILATGALIAVAIITSMPSTQPFKADTALAAKFADLSTNGNSACSAEFQASIQSMSEGDQIKGSCCSPMSMHRYEEQIMGLKKYSNILEIPPDPYDVNGALAKELLAYYDVQLTPIEQAAYDYAMEHSDEKGPCCCKCWHWYVYGGLSKKLIHERGFTGEQIPDIWDLSDSCGGEGDHVIEHHMP